MGEGKLVGGNGQTRSTKMVWIRPNTDFVEIVFEALGSLTSVGLRSEWRS